MKITSFYHVWVGGAWEEPVDDHFQALSDARVPGPLTVGVIGSEQQCSFLKAAIRSYGVDVREYLRTEHGYEQFTLGILWRYAQANRDGVICYAHSKGALKGAHPLEIAIRRSAIRLLITGWQQCAALLETCDAVGQHWLSPAEYPEIDRPFFGGNFWWARADYLATLPPPSEADRWEAERWVGQNLEPGRVRDLRPGWPTWGEYGREIVEILNPGHKVT